MQNIPPFPQKKTRKRRVFGGFGDASSTERPSPSKTTDTRPMPGQPPGG